MRQKTLPAFCLILLFALSLLAAPAAGGASTMPLLNHSGDVQILDTNGVPRFVLENVLFNSGETLVTGEESLASVGMDDSKIITLDALTKVSFIQEGEHMLLNLLDGQIFIDVQEKLDENSSFDIQTTIMTVGIRGTLIFGQVAQAQKPGYPEVTRFGVLEGSRQIALLYVTKPDGEKVLSMAATTAKVYQEKQGQELSLPPGQRCRPLLCLLHRQARRL